MSEFVFNGIIPNISNGKIYHIAFDLPFPGTATSISAAAILGTCAGQFKINDTALGGSMTMDSFGTVDTETINSNNTWVAGDGISFTPSTAIGTTMIAYTITYERADV